MVTGTLPALVTDHYAAASSGFAWHITADGFEVSAEPPAAQQQEPVADDYLRPELPPLWHRIITGASLRWRVRAVVNRARWTRKHAARRALRWIHMYPELRTTLRNGRWRSAVRAYRERVRQPVATDRRYRPAVQTSLALPPDLDAMLDVGSGSAAADPGRLVVSSSGRTIRVADTVVLGPFDVNTWNPVGVRNTSSGPSQKLADLLAIADEAKRDSVLRQARSSSVIRCDLGGDVEPVVAADAVVKLALSGAVLSGTFSPEVKSLVGDALATIIESVPTSPADEAFDRERLSLAIRRQALSDFGPVGRVGRLSELVGETRQPARSVSVLLPSNRPGDLPFALSQISVQCGVDVELVVGLHGNHMRSVAVDEALQAFPGDVVPLHLPDAMNLGDVMNELTTAASARLISKWDDDDWYDRWHLLDLVHALEYSGGGLVAKAAEFVYLERIDLMMRRFAKGGESFSTTVAGGTLLAQRTDVIDVGWASVPRQVDRRLIEAFASEGLPTYRAHGMGYVLRRRGDSLGSHTWQVGDAYFLKQATAQRPGLDLEFAGIS